MGTHEGRRWKITVIYEVESSLEMVIGWSKVAQHLGL